MSTETQDKPPKQAERQPRQISGELIFRLKNSTGLPLEMALDRLIDAGIGVDWAGFVDAARKCGWWDFQTIRCIEHAFVDCGLSRLPAGNQIINRVKIYMLSVPHPKMEDLHA